MRMSLPGGAFLSDIASILAAFFLSGLAAGESLPPEILAIALLLFLLFQISVGAYRLAGRILPGQECRVATRALVYGSLSLCALVLFINPRHPPVEQLGFFLLSLPPAYLLFRIPFWWMLAVRRKEGRGVLRTMIIGQEPSVSRLADLVMQLPCYSLVAVVEQNGHPASSGVDKRVSDQLREDRIDLLLYSSSVQGVGSMSDQIVQLRETYQARIIPAESELLFSHTGIVDIAGLPLSHLDPNRRTKAQRVTMRIFDLVGAAVLVVFLLPLLILVSLAILLTSGRPVLFRQPRMLNGSDVPFPVFKFRSMEEEAEERKDQLRNESNGALFKMRDDPRVTRLGRLMRRYSIDELPQLINIFRGELSLVGPRPLPVDDIRALWKEKTTKELCLLRDSVKPGLTGLWQISGRSDLGFHEMVLLDVYYIEHQSFLFDLEIILRTVPAVLFGKGAY